MTSPGLRALRARKRRHLPAGGTRGTSRRGVYPISICGCWWIVDRLSPCPSHTNPEETL